jgi:hypothetical protein
MVLALCLLPNLWREIYSNELTLHYVAILTEFLKRVRLEPSAQQIPYIGLQGVALQLPWN